MTDDNPQQCTATAKSTGERCQRSAIKGGRVCPVHGGKAPQVEKKAQERLDRMADEVTADVQEILDDLADQYDHADLDDKLAIQSAIQRHWSMILDRTGHAPTERREVQGDLDITTKLEDGFTLEFDDDGETGE